MEGEAKGKTFKMKGHTLPGINQRSDAKATNVAEQGLAGSSAFQQFGATGAAIGGAGNIAQIPQQRSPLTPSAGAGANVGMPGVFPLKPSVAKIYNKSKLTKKVLK